MDEESTQNIDILQGLNIEESSLLNSIMFWKLKNSYLIQHHSDLERAVMKGIVSGRRGRGLPVQYIEDTLDMKVYEAG